MRKENQLLKRIKTYSLTVIRLTETLKESRVNKVIFNQVLRSGTSVGANYLAACYAKSKLDFLNKLKIVEEEIIETRYWLELLKEINSAETKIESIIKETDELTAIFVASIKTVKNKLSDKYA